MASWSLSVFSALLGSCRRSAFSHSPVSWMDGFISRSTAPHTLKSRWTCPGLPDHFIDYYTKAQCPSLSAPARLLVLGLLAHFCSFCIILVVFFLPVCGPYCVCWVCCLLLVSFFSVFFAACRCIYTITCFLSRPVAPLIHQFITTQCHLYSMRNIYRAISFDNSATTSTRPTTDPGSNPPSIVSTFPPHYYGLPSDPE